MESPIDDLIRNLGELRVAADAAEAHAHVLATGALERAIQDATRAVGGAIRNPESREVLTQAREVMQRTARLVLALESERTRSQRIASTASGLVTEGQLRRARKGDA